MKEPVLPKFEMNSSLPDETFPVVPLLFGYATLFLSSIILFLMPIKFSYLIVSLDAARLLGENTALTSGLFLGSMGFAASLVGILYGRIVERINRTAILTPTFVLFGIGYCSLGLVSTLVIDAFAVVCIGLGDGALMPTILTGIAAITPKQFLGRASGGFRLP